MIWGGTVSSGAVQSKTSSSQEARRDGLGEPRRARRDELKGRPGRLPENHRAGGGPNLISYAIYRVWIGLTNAARHRDTGKTDFQYELSNADRTFHWASLLVVCCRLGG
jgi:hypothetical protein